MPGFHRRPLALLICCAFAGNQAVLAAADPNPASPAAVEVGSGPWLPEAGDPGIAPFVLAADDQALPLRMEKKFDVQAPKPEKELPTVPGLPAPEKAPGHDDDHPVFIVADQIRGRSEEITEAEGSVEVRKVGIQLLADKVTYRSLEDEVDALGSVRLLQGEDEVSGPHLRMRLSEQVGFFEEADFKFKREVKSRFYRPVTAMTTTVGSTATGSAPLMISVPSGYGLPTTVPERRPTEGYGHAERIDFEGENQVRLSEASYSNCKPDSPDWHVKAKEMRLDYDREEGRVNDATLVFKDVPIFYSPIGSFPLNRQRKSGFLAANFAASSKNGFDLTVPYYWNLAPNYDVTLYPRQMSRRGFQLGGEGRYADHNFFGATRLEYLPNDQILDKSRHAYSVTHTHNLGQGLAANVNWNGVSDDRYWQDFSSRLLQTSQVQLPRQLGLTYASGSWWGAGVQLLRYQTLQADPKNPVAQPYSIEPQISFSGRLPNVYRTDFSVSGQYTRFQHPTRVEGGRAVIYPQFSLPFVNPAFTVIPKVGLHASDYVLSRQGAGNPDHISRVLPTFTLDSTVFFERDTKWFGTGDYIQTLEPRLFYVYIPYRRQDRIPVFDTGIADFNFAQIFMENRYVGPDRIGDANDLTAALTTRYLDAVSGVERFKAMVGQRYYFSRRQVTIPGETARGDNFSNFLAAFNGLVLPKTYVDAAWEYNYNKSQNERYSVGARYQPDLAKVVSASYRFTRDALGQGQVEQVDVAGQWPLSSRWYAVGRYNYSIRDKALLESIAGLEYNAGCWASRFVVQRLEALSGTSNTTFFFQLELNDFASVGSNPIQLLRRSIPGYGKVNEMPTGGSLLTPQ